MVNAFFLAGLNKLHYTVMNKVIAAGKNPGLLSDSVSLSVSEGILTVGTHEILFPCGLYANTDASYTVSLSDYSLAVSATKSSWTIYWITDSNLVTAPQIALKRGIITQDSTTDYQCVIGWLLYPGNNLDLDNSVIVPAIKEEKTLLKISRPYKDLVHTSIPSDITASEVIEDYTTAIKLVNSSASSVTVELTAYGITDDQVPGELIFSSTTSDTGFSLSAELATSKGTGISAGNTAALASGDSTVKFPLAYQREYFSTWSPFAVNLYVKIPALGSVSIKNIIITNNPRLAVG